MGGLLSKKVGKKDIIIIGLDNAGKTTLFQQMIGELKLEDVEESPPTIGCNNETIQFKGLKLNVMDMGGRETNRNLWSHNYANADAIIIVIDSSDRDRFKEIYKEFKNIFKDELKPHCAFLIFANKQDIEGCATPEEISEMLKVEKHCENYLHKIHGCVTKNSEGLEEAMKWLTNVLKKQPKSKKPKD